VLAKFIHLESVPKDGREWRVNVANPGVLAETLQRDWDNTILFRRLATLRTDIKLFDDVEQLRWSGPTAAFDALAARLDEAATTKRETTSRSSKRKSVRSAARG
jgi:hypothetical protein